MHLSAVRRLLLSLLILASAWAMVQFAPLEATTPKPLPAAFSER